MKKRVGLLGGTFYPPHSGHLNISMESIKKLNLEEVWWVIALKNPLKKDLISGSFSKRYTDAKNFTSKYPKILICDIETKNNINFSIDSIRKLKNNFRKIEFIWLMGADNFVQFHNWRKWHEIMNTLPIAVFNRPGYSHRALSSKAATYYKNYRLKNNFLSFPSLPLPKWFFLWDIHENISSTKIRNKR